CPTVRPPLRSPLLPYTTLFRSDDAQMNGKADIGQPLPIAPAAVTVHDEQVGKAVELQAEARSVLGHDGGGHQLIVTKHVAGFVEDRKSTRLNSSHVKISYAVFR